MLKPLAEGDSLGKVRVVVRVAARCFVCSSRFRFSVRARSACCFLPVSLSLLSSFRCSLFLPPRSRFPAPGSVLAFPSSCVDFFSVCFLFQVISLSCCFLLVIAARRFVASVARRSRCLARSLIALPVLRPSLSPLNHVFTTPPLGGIQKSPLFPFCRISSNNFSVWANTRNVLSLFFCAVVPICVALHCVFC